MVTNHFRSKIHVEYQHGAIVSNGLRVLHETDAILFFGWPTAMFLAGFAGSPFEFIYSLYTFSSPICRDFARALRMLCSLPPLMSNRYALSVRDKNILASGQNNGLCSLQSRPPQIGPQSGFRSQL